LQGTNALIARIVRWPILFIIIAVGLAFVYRYGPSRAEPQWRWLTCGSAFAAIAWIAISITFFWYAANFGSYNKTYGSLAAVMVFMTWVWLSITVILIGAELDAEWSIRPRGIRPPGAANRWVGAELRRRIPSGERRTSRSSAVPNYCDAGERDVHETARLVQCARDSSFGRSPVIFPTALA
jgi:uncharacterized BrkB/YihY/UPF0761 family membrane protein